ncbi:MAG: S-adenosylmethionine:tRNA ribosyltransferase-isomerase [Flavobacteriales bacterium]
MHPRELSIHDFTYELPDERIARHPLAERDASRTLVYRAGAIEDRHFRELPRLLPGNALLVLNDTRVVRARVLFRRPTGALLEFMVLDPAEGRPMEAALLDKGRSRWWCMVGNAKRWKGEELSATQEGQVLTARRIEHREGEHLIEFVWPSDEVFVDVLQRLGTVPLPPYMRREAMPTDATRYNTVFAAHDGSIAAPTASLHFSEAVLNGLAERGIGTTRITLHVGAGTFLPVKSDRMQDHTMHSEQVRVPLAALEKLRAQLGKGPIVPVGTTAMRTLESVYWHGVMLLQGRAEVVMRIDQWEPYGHAGVELPSTAAALDAVIAAVHRTGSPLSGTTALMIAPGYGFRLADALVTNFHQPQSTLLLLVAAFVGPDWRRIYDHALAQGYRFLSYGDGSLLFRTP